MLELKMPNENRPTMAKPQVGNVYLNTKGNFYVLYRETDRCFDALTFNQSGEFIGTIAYAYHYFAERVPVGYVSEIPIMKLDCHWYGVNK